MTPELLQAMADLIRAKGYRCDTFTAATRSHWDGNFSAMCNSGRYSYSIKDVGGNWTVSVE